MDAVISCGDLKRNYYEFIVSNLNKPFAYVLGNHSQFSIKADPADFGIAPEDQGALFAGGILVDGRCLYLKKIDLIVAGFGGSRRYNKGGNQYTETEMFFRVLRVIPKLLFNRLFRGRYLDILVTHAPPRHIGDLEDRCHQGFRVFRWFIRRFSPQVLVHGHIHLYCNTDERITDYRGTRIINAYKHFLLELEPKGADIEGI